MAKGLIIFFIILVILGILMGLFYSKLSGEKGVTGPLYTDLKVTPQPNLPANEYSGWIAWWDDYLAATLALETINDHSDKVKTILPVWYRTEMDGVTKEIPNAARKSDIERLALEKGVQIIPTIANDFEPDAVSALLDNEELAQKTIDELVFLAVAKGYKGWDLDWEQMYPGDKIGLNYFVKSLSEKLHQKGLVMSVTVQAKTGTSVDAPSSQAQDWAELAKYADQIRIMGYDFHYDESEAGAVTPLDLYQKMLDVAVKNIPRDKITIGLPTYGYDWIKMEGENIQYKDVINRLEQMGVKWKRDPVSAALTAKYTKDLKSHEVWFEDMESTRIKINMARALGLYRFSFWRLGGEDPRIWDL